MGKTTRNLTFALLLSACSQEFSSASNHQFYDSSSGDSVHLPDVRLDSMASPDSPDAIAPLPSSDTGVDSSVSSSPDSTVDAATSTPDDAAKPGPTDAGGEAALSEAQPYCVDCPRVNDRPGCCYMLFRVCSYLNGLNHCVQP